MTLHKGSSYDSINIYTYLPFYFSLILIRALVLIKIIYLLNRDLCGKIYFLILYINLNPLLLLHHQKNWRLESDDENEDLRFSLGAVSRLKNTKKQIEKGTSPEDIQRKSMDWYTVNRRRCIDAQSHLDQKDSSQAWPLIRQASDEGFPGGTFELAKHALDDNQVYKAKFYLRKTCEQLREKGHLLDNQYRDETLVKGIKKFAEQNTSLKEILNDFDDLPCFQMAQKPTKQPNPPNRRPDFTQFAEKGDEDYDDFFEDE